MEKKIITFTADEQSLRKTGGIPNYASNKVSYIEAQFELGENWQGFDAVRAIWYNKAQTISMVLADGKCIVPYEVLANKGQVMVNLVGSISENDVLTDRLTTYPVVALIVDADAKVDGSNTYPITPSQFEQFVEAVKADAESASESAESASASAESASASAESAHDDKIEIEQKIAEVIQQIEDFEQVQVVVTTLPAGSQATSDFTDGVLTLGIPQGAKGDTGNGIASCVLNPDYTLTINFTDGTSYITTSIRGVQGVKGDTGNGISSITKTGSETVDGRVVDTYTTTFTDGETTEFKVTNGKDGEVTMSQLSALLPTDTASGSIASFPDGTDLFPAVSVKAQIEPIQDLHGYDKPWAEGAGVNILDPNIKFPSGDKFGLTVTTDGYNYKFVGTATSSGTFETNSIAKADALILPAGTYYFKFGEGRADVRNAGGTVIGNLYGGVNTINEPFYIRNLFWAITNGQTYNTENFIAIAKGSTAPTSWTPYSNICPISGHTECVTEVRGVNVWDEEWEAGGYDNTTGAKRADANSIRSKNLIPVLPNTTYYYKAPTAYSPYRRSCFYDANGDFIRYFAGNTNDAFTTPDGCYFMTFWTGEALSVKTYNNDICINYPSTDHDYHAYDGNTYTTTLGRTVYGGTLEQVGGQLTDGMVMTTLGALTWSMSGSRFYSGTIKNVVKKGTASEGYDNIISDSYNAENASSLGQLNDGGISVDSSGYVQLRDDRYTSEADLVSAMGNAQLCYELATPQTYQLDPQTIDLLLGQNNLWTDCGSVEVTYKADIERWVNKKINALI